MEVSLTFGSMATNSWYPQKTAVGKESSFEVNLGFLHPVQELIITVRKRGNMTSSTEPGTVPNLVDQGATTKNYFAYEGGGTDPNIESHLNKIKAHGTHSATSASTANYLDVRNFTNQAGAGCRPSSARS